MRTVYVLLVAGIATAAVFAVPVDLDITKIQNIDDSSFSVDVTQGVASLAGFVNCVLLVTSETDSNSQEINLYSSDISNNELIYTITFKDSLSDWSGLKIELVINALDSNGTEITTGEALLDPFPELPTNVAMQLVKYGILKQKHLLRIEANDLFQFNETDPSIDNGISASSGSIRYILDFTFPKTEYSLCSPRSGVTVCDVSANVTTPSEIPEGSLDEFASITLHYGNDTENEYILVKMVDNADNKTLDVITKRTGKLCTSSDLEAKCANGTFTLATSTDLFIITLDSNSSMKTYAEITITDYNLQGQQISDKSIELQWDSQNAIQYYTIKLTGDSCKGSFCTAVVNCNPGPDFEGLPCFGYFTDLDGGASEYVVTLQPNVDSSTPDNTNIIESLPISFAETFPVAGLQMQEPIISWRTFRKKMVLKICFNHVRKDMKEPYSHYEFALLNNSGQLLKHYLSMEDGDLNLCFSDFLIDTEDFDLSGEARILVIQRAIDGFSILASGETQLSFSEI